MKSFSQYLQELANSPYGKYPNTYGDTSTERETVQSDTETARKTGKRIDRRMDEIEDMRARRDTSTGKVAPASNQSGRWGGGV